MFHSEELLNSTTPQCNRNLLRCFQLFLLSQTKWNIKIIIKKSKNKLISFEWRPPNINHGETNQNWNWIYPIELELI